jgi:hypothetical protein
MFVAEAVITCCNDDCGISFAVPQWWKKGKQKTHSRFFCPNGHGQSFVGETDEEKFRRERDIARQQLARVEQEAADARKNWDKAERETKRLKKRAAMGTCPCCNRSVSQMERHMKTKHPEFIAAQIMPLKVVK